MVKEREKRLGTLWGVTCWHREKPRTVTFGSTLGNFVLTEKRLMFLSSGEKDMSAGVATELMYVDTDAPDVDNLGKEALNKKQSVDIPLDRLESIELKKRLMGLSNWLSVKYRDEHGATRYLAMVHAKKLPQGFVDKVIKAKERYLKKLKG
ncbi:hypothetical protein [Candidatus Pyrohabitans sp.]